MIRFVWINILCLVMPPIVGQYKGKQTLSDILNFCARKYSVVITYQPKVCDQIRTVVFSSGMELNQVFEEVERCTDMRIKTVAKGHFVVYKRKSLYTITGRVLDRDTGEPLNGAEIELESGKKYKASDFGLYSFMIEGGERRLHVLYPGYEDTVAVLQVDTTMVYDIALSPLFRLLEEVIVTADISQTSCFSDGGKVEVLLPNDATVASRMGKKSALSILEAIPGVTPGNVGRRSLFVRGGASGSNGFYVDGAPIYSISHLYGVNSVFNTNAIDKIEMYKGNIPSRYGNYTGSVTDIFLKNGNIYEHTEEFTVGNFMSDLILQGPIKNNKSSYIVSLRYAYPNLYSTFLPKNNYSCFSFSDLYVKLNWALPERSRLYLSFFYGRDRTRINNKDFPYLYQDAVPAISRNLNLKWRNQMISLRWNKIFSERLFLNATFYHSLYSFSSKEDLTGAASPNDSSFVEFSGNGCFRSFISDYGFSANFRYFSNKVHQFRIGVTASKKILCPIEYEFTLKKSNRKYVESDFPDELFEEYHKIGANPLDVNLYLEDEIRPDKKWRILFGARGCIYNSDKSSFFKVLPFFQSHLELNKHVSLYLGYSSSIQTIQLLPLDNVLYSFASAVWFPEDDKTKPEQNQIVDASVVFNHSLFKLTSSFFFRKKDNIRVWAVNQSPPGILNKDLFYIGQGRAYGSEFFLQSSYRNFYLQLGYVLSFSREKCSAFNSNEWYDASNDVRHSIDITLTRFFLSRRLEIGAVWSLRTGLPYTQAQVRQILGENGAFECIEDYSYRNNARFRSTHYLNLNCNYHFNSFTGLRSTISLGVYNVYYRRNPYSAERHYEKASCFFPVPSYREISIAPIIPYISYTIKL